MNPADTGLGPIASIPKALQRGGLTIDDVNLAEINEAFASVPVGSEGSLGRVELALQASASHSLVAPVLARVTQRRLAFLTRLYTELGLSPARARDRGLLAYTAFLGHAQLAHATPELLPTGRAFRTHVDQVTETLMRLGE